MEGCIYVMSFAVSWCGFGIGTSIGSVTTTLLLILVGCLSSFVLLGSEMSTVLVLSLYYL